MANLRKLFASLDGRLFTPQELLGELKVLHSQNLREFPIEIRTEDLYEFTKVAEWARPASNNRIEIRIS